ncbi:unnamed protein product [Meloidogyne enterolobii]|uniref:Uncharacterized protein n=1 Tax=Meloidogyne enterolobii TaxID=390850 RepID=A0ACB1AZH6_MELEN
MKFDVWKVGRAELCGFKFADPNFADTKFATRNLQSRIADLDFRTRNCGLPVDSIGLIFFLYSSVSPQTLGRKKQVLKFEYANYVCKVQVRK